MQLLIKNGQITIAVLTTSLISVNQNAFSVLIARPVAPYTQDTMNIELGKYARIDLNYDQTLSELKFILAKKGYTLFAKQENQSFGTVQIL
jgi:hypothetical protein